MEGKNSAYIKQYNRRQVLALLQQQPISRAELSRQMGLSRAAISIITEEMISAGMIRESKNTQPTTGPGRTPTALEICEGAFYAVGISLSRNGCQAGIEDLCGTVLACQEISEQTPQGLISAIRLLLQSTAIDKEKLLGIGISSPGPVDSDGGVILNPPDFPLWSGCPICEILSKALDLPVYLENDANAAALFNHRHGNFPEKDHFLLLYTDCGVGSGVISQGRLLRSCELGHCSIDLNGPRCSCGNRGCLELYASIDRLLDKFPQYESWAALMNSPDRAAALSQEADYLAAAIINFSNIIPIGAVLLHGRLHPVSRELGPLIEQRIRGRSLSGNNIRILRALYNEQAPIQSACSIVFRRYLDAE